MKSSLVHALEQVIYLEERNAGSKELRIGVLRAALDLITTIESKRAYQVGYAVGFAASEEEMARAVRTREAAIDYWKRRAEAAERKVDNDG